MAPDDASRILERRAAALVTSGTLVAPLVISSTFRNTYVVPRALFLYLVATGWLLVRSRAARGRVAAASPAIAFLAALLLFTASALLSPSPLLAALGLTDRQGGLVMLATYAVLFDAARHATSPERQRSQAAVVAIVVAAACGYAALQLRGIHLFSYSEGVPDRPFSTFGNAIFFGAFLATAIPLLAASAVDAFAQRRPWLGLLHSGSLLLAAFFLVSAGARGAFAGAVAGVATLVALAPRSAGATATFERPRRAIATVLLAATAVSAVAVAAFPGNPLSRLAGAVTGTEASALNRTEIMKSILRMIADRPLLGYGPEQTFFHFPSYQSMRSVALEGGYASADRAHNEYVQLAVDAGLPAMALGLTLPSYFVLRSLRRRRSGDLLRSGAFSGVVAYLAQAAFGITHPSTLPLALVLAASALAPGERQARPSASVGAWIPSSVAFTLVVCLLAATAVTGAADLVARRAYLAERAGDRAEAARLYEAAARVNPTAATYAFESVRASIRWSVALPFDDRVRALERATAVARRSIRWNTRAFTLHSAAANALFELYRLTGRPRYRDEAFRYASTAVAIAPHFPDPYFTLVAIYDRAGDLATALSLSERLVAVDSRNPAALFLRAQLLERAGRHAEAERARSRAVELQPSP